MGSRFNFPSAKRTTPIMMPRGAAGQRMSVRSDTYEPSVFDALQPRSAQASAAQSAPISRPGGTKRGCSEEDSDDGTGRSKGEYRIKLVRRASLPKLQLSEENLRKFNRMMLAALNSPTPKEYPSSSSADATSEEDTTRTQCSSNSTAKHLATATAYIHIEPPADILAAINAVVKAKISKERRAELHAIAGEFHDRCMKAVVTGAKEDDYMEIFLELLGVLGHSSLCMRTEAGCREEIEPTMQQSDFNLNFLADFKAMINDLQHEVDDTPALQPERVRLQRVRLLPMSSRMYSMGPPGLRDAREYARIETPCTSISMGIEDMAFISALSSRILDSTSARRLLKEIQSSMTSRERGGREKPRLMAAQAESASDLVFPFAVIVDRTYSMGRQVFEVENQAAISGASGLKAQLCLDQRVKRATARSAAPSVNATPPLFFSICTNGVCFELYAHHVHDHAAPKFNQKLLDSCNGLSPESVMDFIVALDNVLRWGTEQHLESVVDRLEMVESVVKRVEKMARKVWALDILNS